jgi:hypothetical protein
MSRKDRLKEISHDQYWDDANQVDWRSKGEQNTWDQLLGDQYAFNPQELDLGSLARFAPSAYNPTGLRPDEMQDLSLGRVNYQNLGDLPNLRRNDPSGYDAAQVGSLGSINDMMSGQGLPQGVLNLLQNKAAMSVNDTADAARRNLSSSLQARGFGDGGGLSGDALLKAEMERGNQMGQATSDIYTNNAMIGNQNRQVGSGMELGRQQANADAVNRARAMGYESGNASNLAEYEAGLNRQRDINNITNRQADVNLAQGNTEANRNLDNYYQRKYFNLGLRNDADRFNTTNQNAANQYNASTANNAQQFNAQQRTGNNQAWINTMQNRAQSYNPLGWRGAQQNQFGNMQTEFTRPGFWGELGKTALGAAIGGGMQFATGGLMGDPAAGYKQSFGRPRLPAGGYDAYGDLG